MHGLGDVVCALPMVENICLAYPAAEITVLVNSEGGKEIVQHGNFMVRKIVVMNVHKDDKREVVKKILMMRQEKYDIGISCVITPVKKAHAFMGIIAPKRKVGIQFSRGQDFSSLKDQFHFVDANLDILKELHIVPDVMKPVLVPNPKLVLSISQAVKEKSSCPRIGVCIGNADTTYRYRIVRKKPVYTRGWGIQNMSVLCEKLLKEGYSLALIGGKQEVPVLKQMPEQVRKQSASFVGNISVSESIAVASVCDVLVGVDTGMQHIADALGIRTVSIFGPTNPHTHGAYSQNARFVEHEEGCKYCFGTAQYVRCKNRTCLTKISIDSVFDMIRKTLEETTIEDGIKGNYQ